MTDSERHRNYTYPETRKSDVADDYHGVVVPDPYRWLEDPASEETLAWVERQNALSAAYIGASSARVRIEARLRALWDYPRWSIPRRRGGRYFFTRNDGLQNQDVVCVDDAPGGEGRVVIDPNTLSDDGTVALTGLYTSHDGRLIAYGLSQSGSDWQTIRVRDVDTGEDTGDVLEWCRFSGVGWKGDRSGFWYNRFPAEGEVAEEDRSNYNRVYWHALGTPQSDDVLVYADDANKEIGYSPSVTDDGEWLVVYAYHGTDPRNGIFIRPAGDAGATGAFTRVIEVGEAKLETIGNAGSVFYFVTDLDAPRGRVVAVDMENPARGHWREVIAEGDDVIDTVAIAGESLVVARLRDAHHTLSIHALDGAFVREVPLPVIGSVEALSGRREDAEMFFSFTSFVYPTTVFRYDVATGEAATLRESQVDFDPSRYTTEQVFYTSKDGTRVPMFLTYRKGLARDGNRPTWLYGYGGFNISLTPGFRLSRIPWLEDGGVYAVANLRGGDEYGEAWHQGGVLERKQNVFDDFIAAAEYLIAENYTSTPKLVINGGSNGGLLVAACMVQRPDLFGAVVCQVPVIDMLRYHTFTVGRYWVSDYGNAEESREAFDYLYAYSPLHNIPEGFTSPPVLVMSADTDDRVVPAHAKKFVATLQANDTGKNPVLLRVETKAGHGLGKPTDKVIEELADMYAFIYKALEVDA